MGKRAMTQEMSNRRDKIVALVNEQGTVSFAQIKAALPNVSEMTLRTDLKALDQERRIVRIHGGARSVSFVVGTDDRLDLRAVRNVSEKKTVAAKAAALVQPNTTVFIDSGSTTALLAQELPDEHFIAFTNSLTVAGELAHRQHTEVYLLGGRVNRYSLCTDGARTQQHLESLSFDQFFMGVTSYSPECGFACGSDDEALLKRACIQRAERTVALMDSSKVDVRNTFGICDLDQVDVVVSDGELPADFVAACHDADVEVL